MRIRSIVISASLLLIAATTWAQQTPPNTLQIARACAADIDRLCPGVPPGEGRIKACMKAHITQLSAPCFDALLGAVAAGRE